MIRSWQKENKMIKLKEAIEELKSKAYNTVQIETAWKWASRACAAYVLMLEAQPSRKVGFWTMAEDYYHEAIEHAALTADDPAGLVAKIQESVSEYQEKAADHMTDLFGQELK